MYYLNSNSNRKSHKYIVYGNETEAKNFSFFRFLLPKVSISNYYSVLLIIMALLVHSCDLLNKEDETFNPVLPPETSLSIPKEYFQIISNSLEGFTDFRRKIETASNSGTIPIYVAEEWERAEKNIPQSFAFQRNQIQNGTISISRSEIDEYISFISGFEPLLDAIEESFDNEVITDDLRRIVLELENALETTLLPKDSGEKIILSKRAIIGRSTWCCCCLDVETPPILGAFNCGRFRARKIWAKIKCKFLEPLIAPSCDFGAMELFKSDKSSDASCEVQLIENRYGRSTSYLVDGIKGFYKGSNGGYYYVRQIDSLIYWFGEDPNGSWANIKVGIIKGGTFTSEYVDLPKGRTTAVGSNTFKVSNDGTIFEKISGGGSGKSYIKEPIPSLLPNIRPAGFSQKGNIHDITGAWASDDGGTYYIRQVQNKVYWFGESSFLNGKRPHFSNIAYGFREGNRIQLNWADVPKGHKDGDGVLQLLVTENDKMVKLNGSEFGGTEWIRK